MFDPNRRGGGGQAGGWESLSLLIFASTILVGISACVRAAMLRLPRSRAHAERGFARVFVCTFVVVVALRRSVRVSV